MTDLDGQDDSPPRKVMRLLEPDLTIVIHYEDAEGKGAEKSYHECAFQLAKLSDFFKAALSNDMKENSTSTIDLHDTTPTVWESAMSFLRNPIHSRNMTHEDVMQVAEFYHKYQFMMGLQLCNSVLVDYIITQSTKPFPSELDSLVACIALAHRLDMEESLQHGVNFVEERLRRRDLTTGALMFTLEHLEELHSLFKEGHISNEAIPQSIRTEIHSPTFPAKFAIHTLKRFVPAFQITEGRTSKLACIMFHLDGDGKTFCPTEMLGTEDPSEFHLFKNVYFTKSLNHDGDWVVVADPRTPEPIMRCFGSRCLPYPPKDPWLVLRGTFGRTKITYVNEESWGDSM